MLYQKKFLRKIVKQTVAKPTLANNLALFFFGSIFILMRRRFIFDFKKLVLGCFGVHFLFLHAFELSASILAKFFILQFRAMYLPKETVARFFRRLVKRRRRFKRRTNAFVWGISALMVKCSGRFSRQQRASYNVYKFNPLGLSAVTSKLRYQFLDTPLKFGAVGLKVYLLCR